MNAPARQKGVREVHAQVLVVGAGPGGLSAAVHAAEAGAQVQVVDAGRAPGGQIWRQRSDAEPVAAAQKWIARARQAGVEFDFEHEVFDAPKASTLFAKGPHEVVRYTCEQLVLATGARERFLPFVGWERPKVMGVGALQALCKDGYDPSGQRIVLSGSGPLLLAVAADLEGLGARSVKIVEQASRARVWKLLPRLLRHPGKLGQAARFGLKLSPGSIRYGSWVKAVLARPDGFELELEGQARGERLACDLLACAFGLVPEIALARALGCESRLEDVDEGESRRIVVDIHQRTSVSQVFALGEMCGIGGVEAALAQGAVAGRVVAGAHAQLAKLLAASVKANTFAQALGRSYALDRRLAKLCDETTVLCRCEGVRVSVATGFDSARTAKLQTRCGMGLCQGRVCGPAFEFLTNSRESPAPRPPLVPTKLSDLALAWASSLKSEASSVASQ